MKMGLAERGIKGIILDVEGTTTPAEFVLSTLFKYADDKVSTFLEKHQVSHVVRDLASGLGGLKELPDEYREPVIRSAGSARLDALSRAVRYLIERDSKAAPLKEIEGKIWEEGYLSGDLRGQVYEDVVQAFKRWKDAGIALYIYSSGSVLSQQLLFRTVPQGDLTVFIDRYFDTAVGGKKDPESYIKISSMLSRKPEELLFISDSCAEVAAAAISGLKVMLIRREDKSEDSGSPDGSFTVVTSLLDPILDP